MCDPENLVILPHTLQKHTLQNCYFACGQITKFSGSHYCNNLTVFSPLFLCWHHHQWMYIYIQSGSLAQKHDTEICLDNPIKTKVLYTVPLFYWRRNEWTDFTFLCWWSWLIYTLYDPAQCREFPSVSIKKLPGKTPGHSLGAFSIQIRQKMQSWSKHFIMHYT